MAVVAIVAILTGAGAGYLVGNANEHTVTSVSTYTTTSVSTVTSTVTTAKGKLSYCGFSTSCSAQNPYGPILTLSVNTTMVKPNGSFQFSVTEINPNPEYINLTAAHDWYVSGLTLPCNGGYAPYGVEVFRGHYSLQNISLGVNTLHFAVLLCPFLGNYSVYSFPPESAFVPKLVEVQEFEQVYAINGFVINGPLHGSPVPTAEIVNSNESSKPEEYTFIAGDEWGTTALLCFTVALSYVQPQRDSWEAR